MANLFLLGCGVGVSARRDYWRALRMQGACSTCGGVCDVRAVLCNSCVRVTRRGSAWPERDALILQGWLAGETYQSLGDLVGLTRERIRQIINREKVAA